MEVFVLTRSVATSADVPTIGREQTAPLMSMSVKCRCARMVLHVSTHLGVLSVNVCLAGEGICVSKVSDIVPE